MLPRIIYRIILLTFITVLASAHQTVLADKPTLNFSVSVVMHFSNPANTGFEDQLIKEVFRRIGYDVNISFVPAERALINLNNGTDDGALGRVKGVLKAYENIREIPEEAFVRDFVVFTRKVTFAPDNWESLTPYNVGYITGWKILERNIKKAKSVALASNGDQLFELLGHDRVDLIIYNRWGGLQLVRDMKLKNITLLEPPLVQAPHYFVLHKKHADLLLPAAEALKEMKKDGTYRAIYERTLAPLANQ